jgi:hypothetical protein
MKTFTMMLTEFNFKNTVFLDVAEHSLQPPAQAGSSFTDFFCPAYIGDMFLRNVGPYKIYTASHPRKRHSS